MTEKTFIIVKPDGVARGLTGTIIARLEAKGFKLVAAKFAQVTREKAAVHYAEHDGKPFFNSLLDFITSSPVMLLVVEGNHAIASVRNLVGKTNGTEAAPGTIRGDYGSSRSMNLIHASDSPESAVREISNFFSEEEIVSYELPTAQWLFEDGE
jgi:nucleoside-diphosphate kinase